MDDNPDGNSSQGAIYEVLQMTPDESSYDKVYELYLTTPKLLQNVTMITRRNVLKTIVIRAYYAN